MGDLLTQVGEDYDDLDVSAVRQAYTQQRAQIIIERLKLGATPEAAYRAALIKKDTYLSWLKPVNQRAYRFVIADPVTHENVTVGFSDAVKIAEEYYIMQCQMALTKAMTQGIPIETEIVKTETVLAKRIIKHPDGSTTTEQYPIEKKTVTKTTGREIDVVNARWFLERRRRAEYGAGKHVDFEAEIGNSIGAILAAAGGVGVMAAETASALAGAVERGIAAGNTAGNSGNRGIPLRSKRGLDDLSDGPGGVRDAVFEIPADERAGGNPPKRTRKPTNRGKSKP